VEFRVIGRPDDLWVIHSVIFSQNRGHSV
jgi:hypothetical protein